MKTSDQFSLEVRSPQSFRREKPRETTSLCCCRSFLSTQTPEYCMTCLYPWLTSWFHANEPSLTVQSCVIQRASLLMCYLKLLAELQNYENCIQFPQSLINHASSTNVCFLFQRQISKKDLNLWTGLYSTYHSHMYFTFILTKWSIIFSSSFLPLLLLYLLSGNLKLLAIFHF